MTKLADALALRQAQQSLPSHERRQELRQCRGLTRQDLADVVGVERTTLAKWETTTRAPRGEAAIRYLTALRQLAELAGEPL